jgi:hypothetical protein
MDFMRRRMLRLVGIGALTIATPTLASALDAESGGAYRIAMGPVSAPMKPGGAPATSAGPSTCGPYDGSCPRPRHPSKRHVARPYRY